jgi:hypothetical protein
VESKHEKERKGDRNSVQSFPIESKLY